MKKILISIVKAYQFIGSPMVLAFGARCRFHPTCSEYAIEALSKHKFSTAVQLIVRRLLRCGPWNPGGVDYVTE